MSDRKGRQLKSVDGGSLDVHALVVAASDNVSAALETTLDEKADHEPVLDALDGLRGICSVFTVVGHFLIFWSPDSYPPTTWPSIGLEFLTAVTIFFVISGFTLVCVYDRNCADPSSPRPLSTWPEQRAFYWKRFVRLAPMYYLGLVLALAPLLIYEDTATIALSIPVSLLWLQSLIPSGAAWNIPLWSTGAFALCYLLFPHLLAARALPPSRLLLAMAACTLASWLSFAAAAAYGADDLLHISGPARLPHFAVGALAALYARRARPLPRPTAAAELCTLVLAADLAAGAAVGTGSLAAWSRYADGAEFALPPVIALWLVALTDPRCGGPTRAALASRPARALGRLSYPLYCLHFPTMSWCAWAAAGRGVSAAAVPGHRLYGGTFFFCLPARAAPAVVAVCIAAAAAAHRLVDPPARRLLDRLGRPSPPTAAAGGERRAAAGER